jgi:AraC-like DNA-binding protein
MLVSRPPCAALRPFVKLLWASDPAADAPAGPVREHVLPTGDMHLAFRVSGPALRVYSDAADTAGRTLGHALVGGARAGYYVREAGVPGRSAGAQLLPGAAWPLFGVPASALAQAHTPLDLLWGAAAQATLDQLDAAGDALARLDCLERLLAGRLLGAAGPQPLVIAGVHCLRAGGSVGDAVEQSGASHRHFIAVFRAGTGLAPKAYARLLRLQQVLLGLSGRTAPSMALLAHETGYADQAHFQRDFREFTGMTPLAWRRAAPEHSHHVRVA